MFSVISPPKNGVIRYLCYFFHFFTVNLSFSKVYKVLPYIQSLTKIRTKRIQGIFVKQIKVLENVQYVMWQISIRKKSVLFKSGIIIVLSAYQFVAFLIQFYHVQYFM